MNYEDRLLGNAKIVDSENNLTAKRIRLLQYLASAPIEKRTGAELRRELFNGSTNLLYKESRWCVGKGLIKIKKVSVSNIYSLTPRGFSLLEKVKGGNKDEKRI